MTDSKEVEEIKTKLILDTVLAHTRVCDNLLEKLKARPPSETRNTMIKRMRARIAFLHDIRRECSARLPKDYKLPEEIIDLQPLQPRTSAK
jgi:hypothetical protein